MDPASERNVVYWGVPCHLCGEMIPLVLAEVEFGTISIVRPRAKFDPFIVYCPYCRCREHVESTELITFELRQDLGFRSHPAFRTQFF
jgi:hypothetical protein